ncbi:MAG TPA: hypothetical protein VF553_11005 [Pyrinomonadaceae bacterium]|jgi:hypothetical protein
MSSSSSSSQEEQARLLAERIARRISQHKGDASSSTPAASTHEVGEELAAMRASLKELQQKLAHIESHLTSEESNANDSAQRESRSEQRGVSAHTIAPPPSIRSPWLSGIYVPAAHPSQERFGVDEAAVSELVDYFEREKTCNLEPGGKPCDHCAMCSSRGF